MDALRQGSYQESDLTAFLKQFRRWSDPLQGPFKRLSAEVQIKFAPL